MPSSPFRAIPSVDKVLRALGPLDVPRPTAVAVARREIASLRADARTPVPDFDAVIVRVRGALEKLAGARICGVINGTGVLIHTNLGRAPLPETAMAAIAEIGSSYNNLEYDARTGERGSRAAYLEHNLALACGAEAATVVNNCAAALVLMLRHFTRGTKQEVIISRGELIQIGGGFRVPEILEASGARLREVGTTNRTTIDDYAAAIGPQSALILKVHQSNFYQGGFTGVPPVSELAVLARRKRIPLAEDLGSGALVDTAVCADIGHERTPIEAIRDGVDLVCFSGDKLFGGPQAGLIAGRARRVAALKREPFFRALRCDKLVLAALQATVDLYLDRKEEDIPVLAMMRLRKDALLPRADAILDAIKELPVHARIIESTAQVGGGTMPRAALPSVALELRPADGQSLPVFAARLRGAVPPVIGYITNDRLRIDLRTVFPREDQNLVRVIRSLYP